jgi:hypothetical protein
MDLPNRVFLTEIYLVFITSFFFLIFVECYLVTLQISLSVIIEFFDSVVFVKRTSCVPNFSFLDKFYCLYVSSRAYTRIVQNDIRIFFGFAIFHMFLYLKTLSQ